MKWLSRKAQGFGIARSFAFLLLLMFAALRVADPSPLQELRLRTFDFFQVLRPRNAAQQPVVIVDIDEKSLKAIGQWPWPRTRVADLVSRLTDMGALVIAFDIVFAEPDRMSPAVAADTFRGLDDPTREKLRALKSNDSALAEAMRRSRVVVGQSGLPFAGAQTEGAQPSVGIATLGGDPRPYLVNFPGLLGNVPVLEQSASGRGLFTIRAENDGIVRRLPLVMLAAGKIVPSLGMEMLRVASGASTILIRSNRAGIQNVAIPGLTVPTDRNAQLWIHFAPHDAARYVSAADVLGGQVPAARIAHRLVLIGTSAVGLLDAKTTPLDPVMPGVEVHAQVLESILGNAVLSEPGYAIGAELCTALLVGLAIILLAPFLNAFLLLVFGAIIAAATAGASWYLYARHGLLIDATYPLLSSALVYFTLVFGNYIGEQAQRLRIRSAFGQYLSPALVEQLAKSSDKLVLGGEEREMTILFSDVRGFTAISELYKDDPQGLTALMNGFLTPLTNAIIERNGTIDKYIGDAVMAFWNAPLHDARHELNACEAALEMLRRLELLNEKREQQAREAGHRFIPMKIGVGINTGRCVVGNMGSDLRFNYSVLGDPVNLASRLEGQSKTYGVPIVIGSKTAAKVGGAFALLELDRIAVKGKTEPEFVYTVIGDTDTARSAEFQRLREDVDGMLACYRRRDFSRAGQSLEACRKVGSKFGLERLFDLYAGRIRSFQEKPPPDNWDAVVMLETK
ncbi:MAG TPA: adenylate/guanylate cyclase domain-containing protein [Pseudolabrys sp.]|nr:adenylate/guanylate cyclase domain-containing protein [Pseudolabrys sp.]